MKKYQIIYADPPWKYRLGKSMGTNFQGAADAEYKTMSMEDICKLKVSEITDKDCILFLWVTFPQLKEGLKVIEAWGFEYKTIGFNWIKQNRDKSPFFGIGYYTKSNGEICLLATKGNPHKFVKDNSISQIVMTYKTKHSQKPPVVRKKIVQLLGDRPRLEMFARKEDTLFEHKDWKGWDVWGNEVESDIKL
jgi:site-specific DNA-methyltransferase (adenine-specific)|tara:strand:- start:206 stop:781 length:576 start_codon:yes stop_codon:yes gene_type:complete